MSEVVFNVDEFKTATKEFEGVIVDAEYSETPFGISGKFERGKVFAIKIETEEYEKPQYEWYPPSNKRLTKWWYFIKALHECGAMRDIVITGATTEERIRSFGNSLIGMKFRWVDYNDLEGFGGRKLQLLLPDQYLGRVEVKPPAEKIEVKEVSEL
jgi:hypothetical protein